MTGAVLHDSERTSTDAANPPNSRVAYAASSEDVHAIHGLVAIANGDDYCVCGNVWPCAKRSE